MENETIIRLAVFGGLFAVFALAEVFAPRRSRSQPLGTRWRTNWSFAVLNTVALRLLAFVLPLLAVGAALDAEARGWGFFNHRSWPLWVEIPLAIVMLDFLIWLQHLVMHKVPYLWRLHRVHHADRDFDVTTAIRFHPVEIALSMLWKIWWAYVLGVAAIAVVLFEILLNGTAMFNHSNLKLPLGLDAVLRRVLVTPDMHRVHHSIHREEHDSNYGFSLSIWDRMMGTYRAQPKEGHDDMTIGLQWQDDRPSQLGWALKLPFGRE